ncbi:MAG: hypothetical protein QMC79_03725 [Anaerosomatales bacterium]|nr:hypothetical protein [Anaerosomatales bacterium]
MKSLRNRPARTATAGLLALALVALLTLGVASAPQSASAAQRVTVSAKLATLDAEPVKILSDSRTVLRAAAAAKTATPVKRVSTVTKSWTAARTSTSTSSSSSSTSELSRAQSILAGYIAKYPILKGSTVSFGDARGYQAICYYKSGRIVISPSHTASLERIIGHEIWHIIDWRDNGVIDWGENVPPN